MIVVWAYLGGQRGSEKIGKLYKPWCYENVNDGEWEYGWEYDDNRKSWLCFSFAKGEDATAFKLRFGL